MKVSELINKLHYMQAAYGDYDVNILTESNVGQVEQDAGEVIYSPRGPRFIVVASNFS